MHKEHTLPMSSTLSTQEASKYLGIRPNTLARWRSDGKGPAYLKLGEGKQGAVRYLKEDLDIWLAQRRVKPEATDEK